MVSSIIQWLARLSCIPLILSMSWAVDSGVYRTRLNGLEVGVDEQTGSLVYLSYPATGVILEAAPEKAGLIDLAYPVDSFTPMRLASRFSRARVTKEDNGIVITWDSVGPSRSNFTLPAGKVTARVTIRAAQDGRSVILACRIETGQPLQWPKSCFPTYGDCSRWRGKRGHVCAWREGWCGSLQSRSSNPIRRPSIQDSGGSPTLPSGDTTPKMLCAGLTTEVLREASAYFSGNGARSTGPTS